jgi:hypothetical protein
LAEKLENILDALSPRPREKERFACGKAPGGTVSKPTLRPMIRMSRKDVQPI